ncbi:hypothetical protein FIBSPDRAFT_826803 [Athelia psychrophila]|uniref:F-box domain-containing protein n=1 Tax=Athelia psychrophila TaxID=1759441 RepID=A0A166J3I9_9AGAM|nr:hypothetical protein FIBSPDRAFT_826803 [Fibularhizoctonia sp. CBS 109695]
MSLRYLPVEVLSEILSLAFADNANLCDILCLNSKILAISKLIIHSEIKFLSYRQLHSFSSGKDPLCCAPRSVTLILPGGATHLDVFADLKRALIRCNRNRSDETGPLDALRLQLHTHTRDPNLHHISDALSVADPKNFVWSGPDPVHHFSIAIVSQAVRHLVHAISAWSQIQHIKLTNVAFPVNDAKDYVSKHLFLNAIPSLRTVLLGKVAFLSVYAVAGTVCDHGMTNLEQVRLVDAYSESIWGRRMRRSDVEKAGLDLLAMGLLCGTSGDDIIARVTSVVVCEVETERIQGGDRIEGSRILF